MVYKVEKRSYKGKMLSQKELERKFDRLFEKLDRTLDKKERTEIKKDLDKIDSIVGKFK